LNVGAARYLLKSIIIFVHLFEVHELLLVFELQITLMHTNCPPKTVEMIELLREILDSLMFPFFVSRFEISEEFVMVWEQEILDFRVSRL
jgi:hypothetical protein